MNGLHIHRLEKCFRHFPTFLPMIIVVVSSALDKILKKDFESNLKYFKSSSIVEFSETEVDWWHPHKNTFGLYPI